MHKLWFSNSLELTTNSENNSLCKTWGGGGGGGGGGQTKFIMGNWKIENYVYCFLAGGGGGGGGMKKPEKIPYKSLNKLFAEQT